MKFNSLLIYVILTLALFTFTKSASAQQVAVNLKPGAVKIVTKPGKTISYKLNLINSGDPQVYILRLYSIESVDQN